MKLFTKPRTIVFLAVFAIAIITALFFLTRQNQPQVRVSDNQSELTVSTGAQFNLEKLDTETKEFLATNSIASINLNITSEKTSSVTMAYDSETNLIPYMGYHVTETDGEITVDLYIDSDSLAKLNKTNENLEFDATAHVFLALANLQQQKTYRGNISFDTSKENTTAHFEKAVAQTQQLKDNDSLMFTISQ